jgi:two-component system sensor histidine kinase VicK
MDQVPDSKQMEVIKRYEILDTPRMAIEAANVGTWVLDQASKILISSARVKELFGLAPEQPLSYEQALLQISDKNREKVILNIEATLNQGKPFHMDFSVIGLSDQKLRWVKAVGGRYVDPAGELSHISGVMMDITVQKESELRKNKFIGMVSHELKTPLTSLKAYVQMLHVWAKKKKDRFTSGALSKMEKQVKKMGNMITGFLSLSQIESGKIHLILKDFDLNELIRNAIEETLLLHPGQRVSFSPKQKIMLHADEDKIDQVLINFLSNAIKYSPNGGTIEIAMQVTGKMVQVSVKDEGLGIARPDKKKLFERYYRVESKETAKIPGFGIGLYLCAEIIRQHKGKIGVESQPGKGSNFFFKLPLKPRPLK